jgi:hypothetical protein
MHIIHQLEGKRQHGRPKNGCENNVTYWGSYSRWMFISTLKINGV